MNTKKTISMRVPLSTKKRLEQKAIELSFAYKKSITWTQLALYLMENGDLDGTEAYFSSLAEKKS
ncbi:hypothetical protein ACUX39_24795 [Salmonella enterica]|nr:MAG TPA: hypothetical protein [Inoviridae sp.]